MKKIFIILLLTTFGIGQFSALTNWSQLSLNYFSTTAKDNIDIVTGASQNANNINTKGKFGVQYQHEVTGEINDKISFDVKEDVFYSDKSHEQRNSFLVNDLRVKIFYQTEFTYFKFQFNNRYYDSGETNFLNLPGVEQGTQQQTANNAILHYKHDVGKLNFNIYTSFRDLEYKYIVLSKIEDSKDEEEEGNRAKSASDYDIYSLGKITFNISDAFRIFSRTYLKNDLNKSSELDETELGGGVEFEKRLDFFNSIFSRFSYYNLDSKAIGDLFTHNLLTEIRYTKRFLFPLAGFVSYKNRSVYDDTQSKLLRVSNLVRVYLKYSYQTQNILDSYVLAGIKYNPENNGNMVFGEFNQFLLNDLYLTAGVKFAPELFTLYSGKLEYYFSSLKSIWLKTEYTDFNNKSGQNIISLGSTLIF
ncbi:MAG: hypothetical protein Q7J16_10545 [Candidatus Cloacimonadales bacterium]|nr:hypothetical protein [Candidatus Cloacimonadales bacterium]